MSAWDCLELREILRSLDCSALRFLCVSDDLCSRDKSAYLRFGIDDAEPGHSQVAVLSVREGSRHLGKGGVGCG